jgi:hypothetical protein
MAISVQVNIQPTGTNSYTYAYDTLTDKITSSFPSVNTSYADGSAVLQANNWTIIATTVAARSYYDIDLSYQANIFEPGINFGYVKCVLFKLNSPDGSAHLIANSSAASNPFDYWRDDFYTTSFHENPYNGWATASHNNLRLTNPTASNISFTGWILGVV